MNALSSARKARLDQVELLRRDEPPMSDAHPIERSIKIGSPEIQEIDELREVRARDRSPARCKL